jgi:hypothetical protein
VVRENGNYAEYLVDGIVVDEAINEEPITPAAPVTPIPGAVSMPLPVGAVAVTVTGYTDEDSFNTFLRYVLAEKSWQSSYLTATIGTLPANLPIELEIPEDATLVGTLSSQGAQTMTSVYLATDQDPEQTLRSLRTQLVAQGLSAPTHMLPEDRNAVFETVPMNELSLFCTDDGEWAVILNQTYTGDVSSQGVAVIIQHMQAPITLCQPSPYPQIEKLGLLGMPPGASGLISAHFVDAGAGIPEFEVFEVNGELSGPTLAIDELRQYYAFQLDEDGWSLVEEEVLDIFARSIWTLSTENSGWELTLDLVAKPTEAQTYLVTMWAKRVP